MALENAATTEPIEGTLVNVGDTSDIITILMGTSAQGTTGFDMSITGVSGDTIIIERRIGPNQTTWGPMESFTTNIERRVNQYTEKAEYRLRKSVGTSTVNYVLAK